MVEIFTGSRQSITYGKEGAWGSGVTPTIRVNRKARYDNSLDEKRWEEISGAGSGDVQVTYEAGDQVIGGDLIFAPQDFRIIEYLLGANNQSGGPTNFTHTYTEANTIPSLTLEVADQATTDFVRTYDGMQLNKLRMELTKPTGSGDAGLIIITASLLGRDVSDGSSTTSVANAVAAFKYRMAQLQLNTSTVTEFIGGFWEGDNNLDDGRYADSDNTINKAESSVQKRPYRFSFDIKVKDSTFWDLWDAGAVFGGTNTLTLTRGGALDDVVLTFTNLRCEKPAYPSVEGGEQIITLSGVFDNLGIVEQNQIDYS